MSEQKFKYELKSFKPVDDDALYRFVGAANIATKRIHDLIGEIKREQDRKKQQQMRKQIVTDVLRLADYAKNIGYYVSVTTGEGMDTGYMKDDD